MRTRDLLTGAVVAILLVGIPLLVGFSRTQSGDPIQPVVMTDPESKWIEGGPLTVQQAYPAVNARSYTAVEALASTGMISFNVPNDAVGFMLAFQTTANADSQAVTILVAPSGTKQPATIVDDYLFGGSVALTGGTQVGSHSNVYCDVATPTDGLLSLTAYDSGAANERVAVVVGDARRFKKIRIIATILAAKTEVYVAIRYW